MTSLASILLVEDNPDDYEAMKRGLERNHCLNPVKWCRSGQHALDYLFRAGPYADRPMSDIPDLVLLDLNMPGLDGRRVLNIIKNDERLRAIPVIILTTSVDEDDVVKCYETGANTYVQKPVNLTGLTDAIARLQDYWFGIAVLPQPFIARRSSDPG